MSGFTNTNTHENTTHNTSHGNPISNTVDALNPKTGSGVGSHGANTTGTASGYNNGSSLTGNHSTTGNPSHFQSTVASVDPARNTGNETSHTSHNPLSSHDNTTTHSSNPLTHGTGTGYGTSTGTHGSATNDLDPRTGTGSHLPSSHHDNTGTGTHNLTSTGIPGNAHNNDSSRPGHGLDTSEVLSGHHSRADPHHDSSVAGSAGAHGLSLEQSRANAGGVTYPTSGGSNPTVGTGAGTGHGVTGAHHGVGADSTHKPSIGEKVKGTVEVLVGKATHNPAKVAEGEALKTGAATTGTGVGGTHSSTTGTGTHNTATGTHTGAHDSSIPHGTSGHSHTGVNDSDTFHNKHEGFAKEHNKDVGHGGSTLAGSGTGL